MKVLVGCECSGRIRDAFKAQGHYAISVDFQPTEVPGNHLQCDILSVINSGLEFHMGVIHPVCTRLANSGVLRLYKGGKKQNGIDPVKWEEMEEAAEFFKACLNAPYEKLVIENPIMHGHALRIIGVKPTQIIQPYNFGEDASKATALWIKGLPKLINTSYFQPRIVDGKKRWSNQTDSGQNKLAPGKNRAKDRARTYPGIAQAMAEQWGKEDAKVIEMQGRLYSEAI